MEEYEEMQVETISLSDKISSLTEPKPTKQEEKREEEPKKTDLSAVIKPVSEASNDPISRILLRLRLRNKSSGTVLCSTEL